METKASDTNRVRQIKPLLQLAVCVSLVVWLFTSAYTDTRQGTTEAVSETTLDLETGRLDPGGDEIYVTRTSHPMTFWWSVGVKVAVGGLLTLWGVFMVLSEMDFKGKTASSSYGVTTKDWVYPDRHSKFKGLNRLIKESFSTRVVWVIAHFSNSLDEVRQALRIMNIEFSEIHGGQQTPRSPSCGVFLVSAGQITRFAESSWFKGRSNLFLVVEHFPLHEVDCALVTRISSSETDPEIYFYVALDEPLLHQPGDAQNEVMKQLIESVTDAKGDFLEHPLLTKALRRKQKAIAQKVVDDQLADSQEEWFEKNT